jgi:acylphosphatase
MVKRVEIGIAGRGLSRGSFAWVEKIANNLNLKGAVFSRPDGSIRVTAEGEEASLQKFANEIEHGGMFGGVENFFVRWQDASQNRGNFHVLAGI